MGIWWMSEGRVGWTIIDKVDDIPESSDYILIGFTFSILLCVVPIIFRIYHAKEFPSMQLIDIVSKIWCYVMHNSWRYVFNNQSCCSIHVKIYKNKNCRMRSTGYLEGWYRLDTERDYVYYILKNKKWTYYTFHLMNEFVWWTRSMGVHGIILHCDIQNFCDVNFLW